MSTAVETQTVTAADIIREVRRIAQENPLAVYVPPAAGGACYYTQGNLGEGKGCVIGQAVFATGAADFERISEREREGEDNEQAEIFLRQLGVTGNHSEFIWLITVQLNQDSGSRMGEAVHAADAVAHAERYVKL